MSYTLHDLLNDFEEMLKEEELEKQALNKTPQEETEEEIDNIEDKLAGNSDNTDNTDKTDKTGNTDKTDKTDN